MLHMCLVHFLSAITLVSALTVIAPAETESGDDFIYSGPYGSPQRLKFEGEAAGGDLFISHGGSPVTYFLSIKTEPGELAASVAARLAEAINVRTEMQDNELGITQFYSNRTTKNAKAEGSTLLTHWKVAQTAGTETGLGIPPPPLSLTAQWDAAEDVVRLYWENTDPQHIIHCNFPQLGSISFAPGSTRGTFSISRVLANETIGRYYQNNGHLLCRVRAVSQYLNGPVMCAGLPSAVAEIEIRPDSISEVHRMAFYGGVAPNWRRWCVQGRCDIEYRQAIRWEPEIRFNRNPAKPEDAPYYQLILAKGRPADGGIYRKFLGLTSGKNYKLNMRLRPTKEEAGEDLLLTVNAACAPSALGSLSAEQLGGADPLAFGAEGGYFRQEVPFQGQDGGIWLELAQLSGADPVAHVVTMPEGCDTLHVWLRLQSNGTHATVGMDWVELSKVEQ